MSKKQQKKKMLKFQLTDKICNLEKDRKLLARCMHI